MTDQEYKKMMALLKKIWDCQTRTEDKVNRIERHVTLYSVRLGSLEKVQDHLSDQLFSAEMIFGALAKDRVDVPDDLKHLFRDPNEPVREP